MVDYEFWFGGKSSKDAGINLQRPIEFSGAVPIRDKVKVAGKNGMVYFETHAFENREGKADCFVMGENAEQKFDDVNAFLFGNLSYQVLQTDEDINHYWLAKVANGADIAVRLKKLAPFSIEFDCKPQRYYKSGDLPLILENGQQLANPSPFTAKPLLHISGSGSGTVSDGTNTLALTDCDDITVDCDIMQIYQGTTNKNNVGAGAFLALGKESTITWTGGITAVTLTPRWWTL